MHDKNPNVILNHLIITRVGGGWGGWKGSLCLWGRRVGLPVEKTCKAGGRLPIFFIMSGSVVIVFVCE